MSRTVPSFAEEGLKRFLHGMDRRIKDLERRGDWRFDTDVEPTDDFAASGLSGQMLLMSATATSVTSGGDFVTFDAIQYRRGFVSAAAGVSSIEWPVAAVGEIQVEIAWDTYEGGGKIEIEVDGIVPSWGLLADEATGQVGKKRKGVDIPAGATVRIKVTQTSGAPQSADVLVEFLIPGRIIDVDTWDLVYAADTYDVTMLGADWWTTEGHSGLTVSKRDAAGVQLSSFEATDVNAGLQRVRGVDTDGASLWVVGERNDLVAKYSTAGTLASSFDPSWTGETGMSGIAVDDDGTLWIVGSQTRTVRHFTTTGTLLDIVTLPTGVQYWGCAYYGGSLLIVDATNSQLLVYGVTAADFGTPIPSPVESPTGAWVADDGSLYVSKDADGVYLRERLL